MTILDPDEVQVLKIEHDLKSDCYTAKWVL